MVAVQEDSANLFEVPTNSIVTDPKAPALD